MEEVGGGKGVCRWRDDLPCGATANNIRCGELKLKTIGIIYDTSYLMLDRDDKTEDQQGDLLWRLKNLYYRRVVRGWFWAEHEEYTPLGDVCALVEVVPHEVVQEIHRHFTNPEKDKLAKKARKRVANLVDRGAKELTLGDVVTPAEVSTLLGADSRTDKLLLGYAAEMVAASWSYAIIATDDGGVLYDCVNMNKAGMPIHCHTKERWPQTQIDLRLRLAEVIGGGWK